MDEREGEIHIFNGQYLSMSMDLTFCDTSLWPVTAERKIFNKIYPLVYICSN